MPKPWKKRAVRYPPKFIPGIEAHPLATKAIMTPRIVTTLRPYLFPSVATSSGLIASPREGMVEIKWSCVGEAENRACRWEEGTVMVVR